MKTYDEELAALVAAEVAGARARHPAGKKLGGGLVGDAPVKIEHATGFVIPSPWLDRGWSTLGATDAVVEIPAPPQNGRAPLSPAGFESAWLDVHWHAAEARTLAGRVERLRFELVDLWDVVRVGLLEPVCEWATARIRRRA